MFDSTKEHQSFRWPEGFASAQCLNASMHLLTLKFQTEVFFNATKFNWSLGIQNEQFDFGRSLPDWFLLMQISPCSPPVAQCAPRCQSSVGKHLLWLVWWWPNFRLFGIQTSQSKPKSKFDAVCSTIWLQPKWYRLQMNYWHPIFGIQSWKFKFRSSYRVSCYDFWSHLINGI